VQALSLRISTGAPQPVQRTVPMRTLISSISAPVNWRTKPFSIMNWAKVMKRPCWPQRW